MHLWGYTGLRANEGGSPPSNPCLGCGDICHDGVAIDVAANTALARAGVYPITPVWHAYVMIATIGPTFRVAFVTVPNGARGGHLAVHCG